MTPAEILLISQLASLAVQGVTSLITARQKLAANATESDTANLAAAHSNFSAVIAAATATMTTPAQAA